MGAALAARPARRRAAGRLGDRRRGRTHWAFQPGPTPDAARGRGPELVRDRRSTRSSWPSWRPRGSRPSPAGRPAHADPPRDVRPDRPAADARGGRGVRRRRVARRLRTAGRPAARLARTTASAGAGTGSTSPATPTPRATSTHARSGAIPYAYTYRDWVIRAFNDDLPYDRFVVEQIAADRLDAGGRPATAGRAGLPDARPAVPRQPRTTSSTTASTSSPAALLGLTVACARCHDHKFDPIPTADYYSLYGVFASCDRADACRRRPSRRRRPRHPSLRGGAAQAREQAATSTRRRSAPSCRPAPRAASATTWRRVLDAARATRTRSFDVILAPDDLNPADRPPLAGLPGPRRRRPHDPVFAPWHAFAALPAARVRRAGRRAWRAARRRRRPAGSTRSSPRRFADRRRRRWPRSPTRYGELLAEVDRECAGRARARRTRAPTALADADRRGSSARCSTAPTRPPTSRRPIVEHRAASSTSRRATSCGKLQKRRRALAHRVAGAAAAGRWSWTTRRSRADAARLPPRQPRQPGRRGAAAVPGGPVRRRPRSRSQHGSGRLELAQAIADPDNPLTARVMVNRVWMHHFGERPGPHAQRLRHRAASRRRHPELLD